MSNHFADRLLQACEAKGSPICVGLDPVLGRLPVSVLRDAEIPMHDGEIRLRARHHDLAAAVEAIEVFCRGVLWACADYVPIVKIQAACFERYREQGVGAMYRVADEARRLGMMVIFDAKRGDIGISSEHYAASSFLPSDLVVDEASDWVTADALTVSPYMGADSLEPFVQGAAAAHGGLFVLVRTSNPGGDALQQLELANSGTLADAVSEMVQMLGQAKPEYIGQSGYSHVGAVVGATKREDAARLRKQMPKQIFLVPGYGAQGGSADDVRACFNEDSKGAIITASRSVLYAYEKTDTQDWTAPVEEAAQAFHQEIAGILE